MRARTPTVRQLVSLCGVTVLAVAGGACASRPGARARNGVPAPGALPPRLDFRETVWPQGAQNPDAAADCEWGTVGHHDFGFRNDGGGPVRVWLRAKSCACARVELRLSPGPADDGRTTWQPLRQEGGDAVTVPAGAPGIVRLSWKGQELGPHRLSAELGTDPGTADGSPITLEAVVNFVEPVQVGPEDDLQAPPGDDIWVGTLGPGASRTVRILAWSSTRADFALRGKRSADPCLVCGEPQRLAAAECGRLGRRDGKAVRGAYRVPVTVREQAADGTRMDLGRFRRRLEFAGDPALDPVSITLSGLVTGSVTVGSAADRGEIALGRFDRGRGKSGQITLTAEPGVPGLEVVACPEFLRVTLRDGTRDIRHGRAWTLTARVPPDSLIGPLPPDGAIVLRTTGDHPRRVRIPVTGTAYFK